MTCCGELPSSEPGNSEGSRSSAGGWPWGFGVARVRAPSCSSRSYRRIFGRAPAADSVRAADRRRRIGHRCSVVPHAWYRCAFPCDRSRGCAGGRRSCSGPGGHGRPADRVWPQVACVSSGERVGRQDGHSGGLVKIVPVLTIDLKWPSCRGWPPHESRPPGSCRVRQFFVSWQLCASFCSFSRSRRP